MPKLLIDTDPGTDIDDLLAILFALRRPELDIKAITTVTWPSDRRVRLIKQLLRYEQREDIPVAAGMQFPLRHVSDEEMRRHHDMKVYMNHDAFAGPDIPETPDASDAIDLIIRTVEEYPSQIILACIAPLTNIACALRRKPQIASKIKAIYMMGGELSLNMIEYNVGSDATASDIVLTSGIPITMGTWSVTKQFFFTMKECDIFRNHASEVCRALGKAIDLWHPAQSRKPGPVMYDMFPFAWALDNSLYVTQMMPVRVETRGDYTRGMTITTADAPHIEVTTDIKAEDVRKLYLDTVFAGG